MLGEAVAVLLRRKVGEDGMGEPVYEWESIPVEGALVRPLEGGEANDVLRPDGVRVLYRIAIPKTYGGPPLANARVALVERGMDPSDHENALRVSGSPDITRPCPTKWNMAFEVGRVDG